jgi:hypothetical protein
MMALSSLVTTVMTAAAAVPPVLPPSPPPLADFGLNLPTQSGSSGTGAFAPGIFTFNYSAAQLQRMRATGFTSVRLPINVPTAHDEASLRRMRAIVEATRSKSAVICMFGTGSLTTHGTGRIDNMSAAISAWSRVHGFFSDLPNVKYEIFNEPHGYVSIGCNSPPCGTRHTYLRDMLAIIAGAHLPEDRCILDSLGWAQDAQGLAALGWRGAIGYHFYSWWLPANATRAEFSALFALQLRGLANRTYVTEFGGALDASNLNYAQPTATNNAVNVIQGMDDAVRLLRQRGEGIRGAFHWHGWCVKQSPLSTDKSALLQLRKMPRA